MSVEKQVRELHGYVALLWVLGCLLFAIYAWGMKDTKRRVEAICAAVQCEQTDFWTGATREQVLPAHRSDR